MIDVVFLLIIFFMVGSNFNQSEGRIELEVPKVSGVNTLVAPPQSKVIQVTKDGAVALDGTSVSLNDLRQQLDFVRRQYPDASVVVRADAKSDYERVAEVLGICSDAKVKINLSFRPGNVVR
jgi:biopolymer transport protein ExbD